MCDRTVLATLPASLSDAWQLVANLAGVSSQELAQVVARQFALKLAPTGRPDRDVAGKLSREVAERFDVAPMAIEAGALLVATADPSQPEVVSHLRFAAGGRPVVLCIAAPEDVEAARMMLYAHDQADALAPAQLLDLDNPALDQSTYAEDQLVRFCRALIRQARKDAVPERPGLAPRHGKAYREIFQYLKEALIQDAEQAGASHDDER